MVYDYPWVIVLLSVFLIIIVCSLAFYFVMARKNRKEREKQNELSRFVSYICGSDETVAEINLENKTISRYGVDGNDKVVVEVKPLPELKQYGETREKVVFAFDYDCLSKELDFEGLKKMIDDKKPVYFEAQSISNGESKWYSYLLQPIEKSKEHPLNYILYRRNIDEIKKEDERNKQTLKDALATAESASAAKGAFLSKVSHEIRTPLNAIIGYISMAKDNPGDEEKIKHYVENSELASKHLLSVINDVLDMSSIESGRLKIANDPFDVKTLLSTISSIYYSQAETRQINFRLVIKSLNYERFFGDSLRVNQILMNLLSNAMKFTGAGGSVTLTVKEKDGETGTANLTFEVKDTGRGMSKDFLGRVFTPPLSRSLPRPPDFMAAAASAFRSRRIS